MKEKKYKCGPNWIPDWLFSEPGFNKCCKAHDIAYEEKTGKFASDMELFKCSWTVAGEEQAFWWRFRARTQAILMLFILLVIPVSYIWYWISKK